MPLIFLKNHIWLFLLSVVFAIGTVGYCLLAPPLYEVSGTVVVHRQRVENPNSAAEDERNRWIWVRDGMGLKESLLSDRAWVSAIQGEPLLRARYERFVKQNKSAISNSQKVGATEQDLQIEFSQELLKQVTVDFTGGDSYSFVVRARDLDPQFAKALVTALMDRTQVKIIQENQQAYQNSLASIQGLIQKTPGKEMVDYLKNTEKQLRVASVLFDSSASRRVEVVKTPHIPLEPVWPKPGLLFLVALFLGASLGFGVDFSLSYFKSQYAAG